MGILVQGGRSKGESNHKCYIQHGLLWGRDSWMAWSNEGYKAKLVESV